MHPWRAQGVRKKRTAETCRTTTSEICIDAHATGDLLDCGKLHPFVEKFSEYGRIGLRLLVTSRDLLTSLSPFIPLSTNFHFLATIEPLHLCL